MQQFFQPNNRHEVEFSMDAVLLEGETLRVEGKAELKMTEYNVEPPTALLGVVRADDDLSVHFKLFASIQSSVLQRDD